MSPRRAVTLLLSGIALTDLMFRVAQVALPLVVLTETGSVAATGLVGGAAGVPVLLSPWWARRLRPWVRGGRSIAFCYLGEAAALGAVPLAAATHTLGWPVLLAAGLALGAFEALDGPGRDALVADLGDRIGPDRALGLLTLRDFFRRTAMVAGPALGGLAVAAGHGLALLWLEAGCVLVAAGLALPVPSTTVRPESPAILATVRRYPEVLGGWVVRGTGCLMWFGFTLGLAVLGAQTGRPGVYVATAMTAYGVGAVLGTPLALPLLRRLPVLPAAAGAWLVTGGCWVAIGLVPRLGLIAVVSFGSAVAVVVGNAAVTALITRSSAGGERRTLLAGQAVVVNAANSLGLLVGGPVIGVLGPQRTLVVTGTLTAVVCVLVAKRGLLRHLEGPKLPLRGAKLATSAGPQKREAMVAAREP